jgi:hypothetical protein
LVHFKPIDGSLSDMLFEEEDWCNLWKQLERLHLDIIVNS